MPRKEAIVGYDPLEAPIAPIPKTNGTGKIFLRTVKLTGILILIACLQVSARTNAQRLSITVTNAPLDNNTHRCD